MPYDAALGNRIRRALARRRQITEKRMFGGLTFLVRGNMFCGIVGNELMARVGPQNYERSLTKRHVRKMDFTGVPLTGYVYVTADGSRSSKALRAWVDLALDYARSLPPK